MYNELRCFFRLCGLSYRHAITLWYIMRYGNFSGPDGYPTDMRNTNRRFDLWQIQSSDYPADMRKSIPDQEMWPSYLFAPRGGACARLVRDLFSSSRNLQVKHKVAFRSLKGCTFAERRMAIHRRLILNHAPKSGDFCHNSALSQVLAIPLAGGHVDSLRCCHERSVAIFRWLDTGCVAADDLTNVRPERRGPG